MPKVSFRMASASRESVFGVQTNTARKIHRSDHTEDRLTPAPSGCCVRKGTLSDTPGGKPSRLTTLRPKQARARQRARRPHLVLKREAGVSRLTPLHRHTSPNEAYGTPHGGRRRSTRPHLGVCREGFG